jgi:hypothetical protein
MSNSDMPAMPTEQSAEHFSQSSTYYSTGLTKREHFAGLAMQGLLASGSHGDLEMVSKNSRQFADALLAELDKSK